jgi:cytochrome c oxidase subunit 2
MNAKRLLGPLSLVALFAVAVTPAAAQGADSVTEQVIWGVNNNLLAIAVPVTLLVEGILFYTVWKYRADNVEEASPTQENRRLEITWTVTTALVLLFVGFTAYGAMANENVITTEEDVQNAIETGNPAVVEVEAYQWGWRFNYPEGPQGESTLVLPADRTVVLNLSSTDVIHSFHAPGLALKQDAFPGQTSYLMTNITNTGTYKLYCAEYCGAGHSKMLADIQVVDNETYSDWVEDPQNTTLPSSG